MNRYVHTTIKMGLAGGVTTLLSLLLGLEHAVTGGILAVLSTQLTRRDSIRDAGKRLLGVLVGLALGTILFLALGYTVTVFAALTFIYAGTLFALKLGVAIVPGLVLISHVLSPGTFSWAAIGNAAALMGLAVTVALALNLTYPLKVKRSMQRVIRAIDTTLSDALVMIASSPVDYNDAAWQSLDAQFHRFHRDASLHVGDAVFGGVREASDYVAMRRAQWERIERIRALLGEGATHPYAEALLDYVANLADDIGKDDRATPQKHALKTLLGAYRKKPLPDTRDGFEARAALFQCIHELEGFLEAKIRFHRDHPEWNK